jgi:plasmid stability protein
VSRLLIPGELVIIRYRAYNACIAITLVYPMASLTIRNFDDALKSALRLQAARHGHSMEQEVREILRRAVQPAATNIDFAQRIQKRFAGLGIEELPIPKRRAARIPETPKA